MSKATYVSSYDRDARTPDEGSRWDWYSGTPAKPLGVPEDEWEPTPYYEPVVVMEVKWNGEEWWVRTRGPRFGSRWNDLSVFWENAKPR